MLAEKKTDNNFIKSLHIQNFRNHEFLEITTKKPSIVIYGKNGVGKTSILEAISIFSNGKGIRNSKLLEMVKVNQETFCISINLQVEDNIFSELKSTFSKSAAGRRLYVNGKEKKKLAQLRRSFPMLWITPYDEKIFTGSASLRRNFLDRLICNFDFSHSQRINNYNKLIQQRSKVLKTNSEDTIWLETIEDQLAKLAVAISSTRLDIVNRLSIFLSEKIIGFPKLKIEFIDSIENNLLKEPAIKIEETLKLKLKDSRKLDLMMGGSLYGSHKTEFFCYNKEKNMPAEMCSSGEQKLLLVSIILSCAKALKKSINIPPIMLLDEVFTHLDLNKKNYLFNELMSMGSQIWITTTETDNFLKKYDNVYYYELKK